MLLRLCSAGIPSNFRLAPLLLAAFALCASSSASAQNTTPPQRKVPPTNPEALVDRRAPNAAETYLVRRFGVSPAAARQHVELRSLIGALKRRLIEGNEEGFSALWVEHSPVYKIMLAFAGGRDRAAILQSIDPKLRGFIQFKTVRRSRQQRMKDMEAITAALRGSGFDYIASYDGPSDTIVIEVDEAAEVAKARNLIPTALQPFIEVKQGRVPIQMQVTGATANDAIYGGWWYYAGADATVHNCSFAFPAKNSAGTNVILTAAHCGFPYYIQQTGHMVRLADKPLAEWPSGHYDYEVHNITGLATGPYVWFDNNSITYPPGYTSGYNNTVPGYQEEGYFRVVWPKGFYEQFNGDPVCKSGRSTGYTCGLIVDDNAAWHGTTGGWIRWGESEQDIVVFGGDSGGAVFQMAINPGDVHPLGILSGGTQVRQADGSFRPCLKSDGNCTVVHMPIDRVDDQQLITLITASQQ